MAVARDTAIDSTSSAGQPCLANQRTDHNHDETLWIGHKVLHVIKQLLDELSTLAEPLGEQRVRVDLDELDAVGVSAVSWFDSAYFNSLPTGISDGQLVRERPAQRRLSRARRAVHERETAVSFLGSD
jgi:hypothetical protein